MSLILAAGATPIPGYQLVRRLGRGGFGEVWEARAPGGFRVALKFIPLEGQAAGPELRALEVIREIRHPHLLDIQFAVQVEDYLVVAMPLCDRSLWDRWRECREQGYEGVPREELLGYVDELARAVDYLNEPRHLVGDAGLVGVQHRDIKPHNVFLLGGSVRLADFGLAKILEATIAEHSGSMSPNYAAPEVLRGETSQQTDQYALAVTYVQLRTGHLPFPGPISDVVLGHIHRAPDISRLSPAEQPAVARALSKRPEDRWPSCREFVRALREGVPWGEEAAPSCENRGTIPGPLGAVVEDEGGEVDATRPLYPVLGPGSAGTDLPSVGMSASRLTLAWNSAGREPTEFRSVEGRPQSRRLVRLGLVAVAGLAIMIVVFAFAVDWGTASKPSQGGIATGAETGRPEGPTGPVAAKSRTDPSEGGPAKPLVKADVRVTSVNSIGMTMVLMASGEFPMGSPASDPDAGPDESPVRRVRIAEPFYLDACETTQEQFRTVMGRDPSLFAGRDHNPVEGVSWYDAIEFCNRLSRREGLPLYYRVEGEEVTAEGGAGYRLPTEAEWEYACRAGRTARFGFDDDAASLAEHAWFAESIGGTTHPVGQKAPNPFGLFDMQGNVQEWCEDRETFPEVGTRPAASEPDGRRVQRGGSYQSQAPALRCAARAWNRPTDRVAECGFRPARSAPANRPGPG